MEINNVLKLSDKLSLPGALLAQHMAVLGKTRSGKSSVMRLFVESLLARNERVCVIDPKGDWHGLRSSADGKHAGYPVVIFGGQKADIPLNAHAGASVAELVANGNRPCVIDLGGWMVGERTRFFIDFASTLFKSITQPLRLVIDEVHNFAPQGKVQDPEAGKMIHWSNRLASEGAGKGLVILSASQRPQKVHKDFLTCAETLVAMRVIHPLDRNAIKEWIDGCPDPAKGKEVLSSLASMERGEGWVWSPEAGFGPERVKFPMFNTYDSFAAPVVGKQFSTQLKGWASVDLEDVKAKMAATIEKAKADDPKELRKKIAELEKQLKEKGAAAAKPVVDQVAIDRAVEKATDRIKSSVMQMASRIDRDLIATARKLDELRTHVDQEYQKISGLKVKAEIAQAITHARKQDEAAPPRSNPRPSKPSSPGDSTITGGLRRMLIALAQRPQGLSAKQLGVRAGLSSTSGTFGTYLGKGRSEGWIDGDRGLLNITGDGIIALGSNFEPLPTGRDLLAFWLGELGESGAARMLRVLADNYPRSMSREEIGEAAGISHTSGTFGTYLGKLRTLELVTGKSDLKASDELFE